MIHFLRDLRRSDRGATAIEYALIASLIAIAGLGGYQALGGGLAGAWNNVSTKIEEAKSN